MASLPRARRPLDVVAAAEIIHPPGNGLIQVKGRLTKRGQAALELRWRRQARGNLLPFTEYTHPKWETHDHHVKVCHYLDLALVRAPCQHCGQPIEWIAIFAPARSGKTEISLRRFAAFAMGRNPGWHVISAMANGQLAADTGGEVRDIIDSVEYQRVFPGVTLKPDARAAGRFIVINQGSRGTYFSGGFDGSFPGRGANVLDMDDPHRSAQEADSARMRDLAARTYFGDLDNRVEYPSIRLLTNTRRHQDDLAGRILPPSARWEMTGDEQFFCAGRWHVLRMRAIENEGLPTAYGTWTKAVKPGQDPLEFMLDKKSQLAEKSQMRHWNSEFQQEPSAEEGTYLRRAWFAKMWVAPELKDDAPGCIPLPGELHKYLIADFAVTEESGNNDPDRTELGVVALDALDRLFIIDWVSLITESDVWVREAIRLCREHKVLCAVGESGVIKNAVWPIIKREMADQDCWVRWEWSPTQGKKHERARGFQGWAANGKIIPPYESDWWPEMLDEFAAFNGGGRYKDKVDAFSNFFYALETKHAAIVRRKPDESGENDSWEFADRNARRGRRRFRR